MAAATGPLSGESRFPRWLQAAALVVAVLLAYANSFRAPFVFDDHPAITDNLSIRDPLHPLAPAPAGSSVVGRPVINWSFAFNYALGGLDPFGYHVVNFLIHAGAGLLLWGGVRRTLGQAVVPGWLRERAEAVAWASALVWLLHPLQTESVTGVVQRTESLSGLLYLGGWYAFVRATAPAPVKRAAWYGLCVGATWLGMATKETMATLPVLLLLYDRTFVAGNFRAAWRERWGLYLALACSWALLASLMISTEGRGGTVTLDRGVNAWTSLLNQGRAIAMYLRLAVWPHPLVLDYGDYLSDTARRFGEVALPFLAISALALAGLYALVRRPVAGFAAGWFFLILGPSSSLVPLLSQMRAEHRMYLPLAAVVVPAVALLWRYAGRAAPWLVAAWALALGAGTFRRNHDYRSELAIWTDTVEKVPDNPRAQYSRAVLHGNAGNQEEAERGFRAAVRLRPGFSEANIALALLLLHSGRGSEAPALLARVKADEVKLPNMLNNYGYGLALTGQVDRAIPAFEESIRLDPTSHDAHNNLGFYLAAKGRFREAVAHFEESLRLKPHAAAYRNLGKALIQEKRIPEALAALEESLRLEPDSVVTMSTLGMALLTHGKPAEGLMHFQKATQLDPTFAAGWLGLGVAYRQAGRTAEARAALEHALELDPKNAAATRELKALGR